MTKQTRVTAARWRDRPPARATLEDRAAALMQAVLPPGEPDDAVLARVGRRLLGEHRQPLRAHLVFRLALAALALVAGGASVKAYEWVRQATWPVRRTAPPAPQARARTVPSRQTAKTAPVEAAQPPNPSADHAAAEASPPAPRTVAPRSLSAEKPAPATRATPANHEPADGPPPIAPPVLPAAALEPAGPPGVASSGWPRPAPVATPAAVTDEITALDRAMAVLRHERNAEAALAALDDYLRRYPNGFLQREALSGKVDALLMLRRPDQALAALETFPFDNHRRSVELQVIRGELRARKDCTRAITDFDAALGRGPDAALLERILYGRAGCRVRTGDQRGAAADLQRYVERFPEGDHASWARRWLESNDHPPGTLGSVRSGHP
jgi:TolA-binding protein